MDAGYRGSFDLILADPPYDMPHALEQTVSAVTANSLLREGGKLVYELRASQPVDIPAGWIVAREKIWKNKGIYLSAGEEMNQAAIYAGTFDPLTYGHLDVIERAARIFPRVVVGVAASQEKSPSSL